jgi:peptidoglycan/xylan/chitin deacetylase (PgdA/CDA1 family)
MINQTWWKLEAPETIKAAHPPYGVSLRTQSCRRTRVLLYHRIVPGRGERSEAHKAISEAQFREHLTLLDRWGYTPITFKDFDLISEGELPPPRRPIILTFDDGYKDTYEVAFPILQEFGMRAVIFGLGDRTISTNRWDESLPLPRAELIKPNQLLELHQAGFEIGSHTMTHPNLTLLPREQAWDEILLSRMRLEIILSASVDTFAYPYGLLTDDLKKLVREAGYKFACSVWSGPKSFAVDPYEISRIEVTRLTGLPEFALKVIGPYPTYHWLREKARSLF